MPGGVTLGPIVRNPDGSVKHMSHEQAVRYCATRGGLPTAKQLAMALSPEGVSATERKGFYKVSIRNQPAFYYNSDSYKRPSGDEGSVWFWSSSVYSDNDNGAYVFGGGNGSIENVYRGHKGAVRCLGR